ncbi:unnamed protein product [Caenorhabditis auriculariae]|uniref:Sulfotransferase domain-containing protein n=1 Tax=Caenorhabditis auriculariae TaxID=2777116 RepID=A0A8S1H9A1_9PELO|nr:unnamed protein product [Caenorhabditis auriculariae]
MWPEHEDYILMPKSRRTPWGSYCSTFIILIMAFETSFLVYHLTREKPPVFPKFYISKNVSNIVVDINKPDTPIPPFFNLKTSFFQSDRFKLKACALEKSMSSVLFSYFCVLHNTDAYMALPDEKKSERVEYNTLESCKDAREIIYQHYATPEAIEKVKHFRKFVIVRDPFERFVSGFVDRCDGKYDQGSRAACYGCEKNLTCVMENLLVRLQGFSSGQLPKTSHDYYTEHFMPFTWQCNLDKEWGTYEIIPFDEKNTTVTSEAVAELLKSSGVPENVLNEYRKNNKGKNMSHTTHGLNHREEVKQNLLKDPYLMGIFRKIFYYDYILLGFDQSFMNSTVV